MLVWFDANTPKQALLFSTMGLKLGKLGYKFFITAREYDATLYILQRLGVDYFLVGKYGGGSLIGKLRASVEKMLNIINLFAERSLEPDVAIYFGSPEASRVSFGLGIPGICINDTPHSIIPIRLSIPLSDYLILPKAVPKSYYFPYISGDRILQYDGVDVLEWVFDIKPDKEVLKDIGVDGENFIVFRPEEGFASYYQEFTKGKPITFGLKILNFLLKEFEDYKIVILVRYKEHFDFLERFKDKNIVVPRRPVLGIDLYQDASIVITGGETMALEASILGTPSITYFPKILHPTFYLRSRGFPIFHEPRFEDFKNVVSKILRQPDEYRLDTRDLVKDMERPSEKLLEVFNKLGL